MELVITREGHEILLNGVVVHRERVRYPHTPSIIEETMKKLRDTQRQVRREAAKEVARRDAAPRARRSPELGDEFQDIAQRAISEAEGIKCPFSTFVAGLKTIVGELTDRLRCAQDEMAAMEEKL